MAAPTSPVRPTTRLIAARARVTSATVSLALRNHPRIPLETRQRIRKIARELGYRPDPELSKLMHYLRSARKPQYHSAITALTTLPEGPQHAYVAGMVEAARKRAEEQGYGFQLLHLEDAAGQRRDLQRILRNRGVEGLLLLPLKAPLDVSALLDWKEFSVVAATYGAIAPAFHRVLPHQFNNMLTACRQLAAKGYRRIGLVQGNDQDLVVHHNFSAAVSWQNLLGGTQMVMPLLHNNADLGVVNAWFASEKPDVIIAGGYHDEMEIPHQLRLKLPGKTGFAVSNRTHLSGLAGVDERPAEIGARAVDQLAAMIQRGEKGVPRVPMVTMIEGQWIDGASARGRRH